MMSKGRVGYSRCLWWIRNGCLFRTLSALFLVPLVLKHLRYGHALGPYRESVLSVPRPGL